MVNIIVKSFTPHYNSAMDKIITSERQYKEEMKRGGYVPYEEAQERTKRAMEKRDKFTVSDKALDWMRDVKSKADKKGNVKLSDRQIDTMKQLGTITNRENPVYKSAREDMDRRLPEAYRG